MSGRRRLTASQWFAIAVGALVAVGLLGTVASLLALSRLSDAQVHLADRLSPTAITVGELRASMIDQEAGVHGYVLSGDGSFLGPYEEGRRTAAAAIGRLERYARLDGVRQLRPQIEEVIGAARRWQDEYGEPTRELVRRDPRAARGEASARAGKRRFDDFRAAVARLQSQLIPERDNARDRLDRNADVVLFWVLGTGIVVLLSVAAVALILRSKIVNPLARLASGVRTVAHGEFEHPVAGSGAREVVDLGEDVERMRARIVDELEALREAETELRRSNAELEQFAYVASHDLQEPLRKVGSFCQLLQQRYGGQLDERADQYIAFAVDGARRMQDLINDLLAFSRVGRMQTDPHGDVDCNALVARVRADLARTIEDSEATIAAGELPAVRGDAGLLRLVFQNLCANAIKFRGDAPPVVTIDASPDDGFWRFRVSDNGIGIDAQYAERIFVLFQRLHTRTQYEGTGIGLAMCRKIVEYHGGRMWLDTGEASGDGGSTFYFTLPR